ncbi:MAG TPA: glycine cleavage T C-terminal barrel domain-containing protein [Thermoanaerobaculia bacterium]|nr:glycine cleavage T C-terminal barrel domain-containing protein [Thermoanaerobaculia bacterium]
MTRPLPLEELHQRLGATFAPLDGGEIAVPARYGSVADEVRALRDGCGLVDRSWRGRLELLGADRNRFLNAYVTCDVKALAPGQGAYGFFTSPQGRILSDAVLLALEDRLWVETAPGQEGPLSEHLRKYILADRVEIRMLEDMLPLSVIGPGAKEALGVEPPFELWAHARTMVHGTEVELQKSGQLGAEAYTLWVSASIAGHLVDRLLENPAVRPVGFQALEILRTEAGIPRFGTDFGPDNFPQETGIESAVSYTKGCYLGQEVVARIHYRGGVQKVLRGLVFEGGAVPNPGTPLTFEGREAGTVTTVADSRALGRPVGLSILHRRAAAPGSRLDFEGGQAEVAELPFTG